MAKMDIKTAVYLSSISNEALHREYYVDPLSGEKRTIYTYFGEIVPKVTLTGKLADRASALSLILRDLESARKWYAMALEFFPEDFFSVNDENNEDETAYHIVEKDFADKVRPLMIASVTFYGKAFTSAEGRKIKAEKTWLSEEHVSMHDYIIDLRNNFAAHGGVGDYETAETVLLLLPKSKKNIIYFPTTIRSQINMFKSRVENESILKHFDYVISILNQKYHALFPRLIEVARSKSILYWMSAAQGGIPIHLDSFKK